MALNSSQDAIIDNRRRQVASLRLRGLTQREIMAALEKNGVINPHSGNSWQLGTINGDIKALEAEWHKEAIADIQEHKARVLAELSEVKRAAWGSKEYKTILDALKQERDLLGLDMPTKVDVTWRDKLPPNTDPNEVIRQFRAIMQQAANATKPD